MRSRIALPALIVLALASISTNSYSAPGATLFSLNLPTGNEFGLSVAVDPAGNIFYTRFGIPTLYKIADPTGASLLSSVPITTGPLSTPIALGEMVWDVSNNVLLAGSEDTTPTKGLYSLNPTTGVATNVFAVVPVVGFPGLTFKVDGLTVDSTGTVWYHPDGSSAIYVFLSGNISGIPDGSIIPKDSSNNDILCCISGIEAGSGNTLIAHLFSPPRLLTVTRTTGNHISELPYTPPPNVGQEGISCDTINFAPTTAVWVRNYGVLTAVEVPSGSCPSIPVDCPEDPTAKLTAVVDVNAFETVQAAFDAAANGAVIGVFTNTTENVVLGGDKTLTITQCTKARVTAKDSDAPVFDITSTGELTIVSLDTVGGTVGWLVGGNGGHSLKSIRANGASQYGIQVISSNNKVSWNSVGGNGGGIPNGAGVLVEGDTNDLRGGTLIGNVGDGIQIAGHDNNLQGAKIESNIRNGVYVSGIGNTIKGNKANKNTLAGFKTGATATGSKFGSNASNESSQGGSKENGGPEFVFLSKPVTNLGSNKADNVFIPAATKCATLFSAGGSCE